MNAERIAQELRGAGVVAAEDEAVELLAAARSPAELTVMVDRRAAGEPLAWITGTTTFLDRRVTVEPGVYVPRWKSEEVARHALTHLPEGGVAIDLCTGSGAIAASLSAGRPGARVLATDVDPAAVACARGNGVEALLGDLFAPLPDELRSEADVVVAVPPYVPHGALALLPPDVVAHEPTVALDGGEDGLSVVERILTGSVEWLRPGGALVLELGVDQIDDVADRLNRRGWVLHAELLDGDGDPCGLCALPGQ